jgi:hypothetical protein
MCYVLATVAPVLTQGRTGGLYGATRSDVGGRDRLTVELFLSQAVSSGLPSEFRSFLPEQDVQAGHRSTLFAASTDFAHTQGRLQLSGTASTYFRYDWGADRIAAMNHHAEIRAGIRLPDKARLNLSQTATYSPPYLSELFPTAAPLTLGESMPVNASYRTDSSSYRTSAALEVGSARGTQLAAIADYETTGFNGRPAAVYDLTSYSAGAKASHAFSRTLGVSAKYQYYVSEYAAGEDTKEHRTMLGVTYSVALSSTRRATLRAELSPSLIEFPVESGSTDRRSNLQGEVSVEYPFRPNWRALVRYRRAVDYAVGLTEPVLSNGIRVELNGAFGRRIDMRLVAGRALGNSAISLTYQNLNTSTAQARVRYALSRAWAMYSEYLFASYDLGQLVPLATGFPRLYNQHEIRVGVSLFARALGR